MKKGQHPKALAIPPFLYRSITGETAMYMEYINDESKFLQDKKNAASWRKRGIQAVPIMVSEGETHYE